MNSYQNVPVHVHVCKPFRVPVQHAAPSHGLQSIPTTVPRIYVRRCECKATSSVKEPALQPASQLSDLKLWLAECHDVKQSDIKLEVSAGLYSSTEDFRVTQDVQAGEALLALPADLGITAADAHAKPSISGLTEGRSELVCLALWLMAERSEGSASVWQPYLASLPRQTDSPILWTDKERKEYLRGSAVAEEAASRGAALDAEWESIAEVVQNSPSQYPPGVYSREEFRKAMSVVFAHAAFLDSAQCFALLPIATLLKRTGAEDASQLDFNLDTQMATLKAGKALVKGDPVAMYDGRPNTELLLAAGVVEDQNPSDCLSMKAELVRADKLYSAKKAVVESLGFTATEEFPIFQDRMPLQLLAYMRLSRLTDPAQLASVSFDRDVVISQNNEYEILQLMMGDCRDRLSNYPGSIEDNVKKLQRRDLARRERLATRMVLAEQRILQGTVDAVRRRLAPIRGVPTKSGSMSDPNEDLRDIFDSIESIPKAPAKLLGGIISWARGEQDPTWKKKGKKPPVAKRPW